MRNLCRIDGCHRISDTKGMCQTHWRRVKTHGDPSVTNRRSPKDGKGYRSIGVKNEHVIVAERALGKPLPKGAVVHHVDEDKSNNAPGNLVICPSMAYHSLLHIRMRAFAATGDYNKRKCKICRTYDDPTSLTILETGHVYHPQCNRDHVAKYAARKATK